MQRTESSMSFQQGRAAGFFVVASLVGFAVHAVAVLGWFWHVLPRPEVPMPPSTPGAMPVTGSVAFLVLAYCFIVFVAVGIRWELRWGLFVAFATVPLGAAWAAVFAQLSRVAAGGIILVWLAAYVGALIHTSHFFGHDFQLIDVQAVELTAFQKAMLAGSALTYPLFVLWNHHGRDKDWASAAAVSLLHSFAPFVAVYPPVLLSVVVFGIAYACWRS